jgi:nucleoid DNA-binding protein
VDTTAFIRELLFGHDCVIVPGFGGFIGNYIPARLDKSSGTFNPPVKQISFNRNLNHNDGLLIGRISESAKINYGDARNIVEEFVDDIKKKLSKGEKVVFDNLGTFVLNQEGNIQFEPDKESNYCLNSYGLTSFHCIPLEGYDVRKRIVKYKENDPVRQTSVRKILWRAAIIIPLLAAIAVVSLKTDILKSKAQTTNLNPLAAAEFDENKKAVDKSNTQPVNMNNKIIDSVSTSLSDEVKEEKVTPPPPVEKEAVFYLITGSFKSEENASTLMNKLVQEGFKPELLNGPNGFYRVSAMSCVNMVAALNKRDSITKKFPGTWITKARGN